MSDYMHACKFAKTKRLSTSAFVLNARLACFVFSTSRTEDSYVLGCFHIFPGYS